jgi:hypothetical protein
MCSTTVCISVNEIDDRCGSAILTLPRDSQEEVLKEFVTKKTRVRNPIAFLMGMLKSKRGYNAEGEGLAKEADGEEGETVKVGEKRKRESDKDSRSRDGDRKRERR